MIKQATWLRNGHVVAVEADTVMQTVLLYSPTTGPESWTLTAHESKLDMRLMFDAYTSSAPEGAVIEQRVLFGGRGRP